jgi:hypothetical protein
VRSARDARPEVQVRIGRLFRHVLRRDVVVLSASRSRRQREHLQPSAVDADLHLMRLGQPLDELVAIARQAKLELIFAVGRKRVPHAGAGARAERLPVEVIFLRQVRGRTMVSAPAERTGVPTARRLIFCAADRYRSSSMGDRPPTLMLSNPWLESSLGRSVSTSTPATADRDGVLILRAIQTAEGVGAAGIRGRRGDAIERCFKVRDQLVLSGLGWPRTSHRRHRARPKLANHELPALGIGPDVGDVERTQDEISLLGFLVMTADAVPIQKRVFGRNRSLCGLAGLSRLLLRRA